MIIWALEMFRASIISTYHNINIFHPKLFSKLWRCHCMNGSFPSHIRNRYPAKYVVGENWSEVLQRAAQSQYYKLQIYVNVFASKKSNSSAQSCEISSNFGQVGLQPRQRGVRRFRRIVAEYNISIVQGKNISWFTDVSEAMLWYFKVNNSVQISLAQVQHAIVVFWKLQL